MREAKRRPRPRWTLVLLAAAACGDNRLLPDAPAPGEDGPAPVDTPPDGNPLDTLAGTGLCVDRGCMQISPDVREYAPQFPFWDDEAAKRRWIYLPPGTQIDTSDMDRWVFPAGTKVWKEFTRDTTRVETRLIMKQLADDSAPGAWFYATYQWNASQDGTMAVTSGVQNANGTQHDIPTRSDCRSCHERLDPSRVLGFQAIQLDYDAPEGMVDLDSLIADNLLTAAPGGTTPRFSPPGNAIDGAALGYLHGNCGHCHNPSSDLFSGKTPIDLRLRVALLGSVAETPAYTSTVNQPAAIPYTEGGTTYTTLIIPDDPAMSAVISRMSSMLPLRFMPNVAVEMIDPAGQTALVAWINSL
jgi:hypothetical protein